MIRILQAKWTALILGMLAYALTTWLVLFSERHLAEAAQPLAGTTAATLTQAGPSWTFDNPELNQLIAELKEQREALRARASQLDELEARLRAERQEIYAVTQTVHQLRADLDATVVRISAEEAVNLKKLSKLYGAMAPESAARVLKEMEDEQIVKILALMRESDSARILECLGQGNRDEPKRAAMISNRLRLTLMPPAKASTP